MPEEKVICDEHGAGMSATFTCRHIARGEAARFLSDEEATADAPWPDAYCEQCAAFRDAQGGEWNDVSEEFADVTVLCHRCYEDRRRALVPVPTDR